MKLLPEYAGAMVRKNPLVSYLIGGIFGAAAVAVVTVEAQVATTTATTTTSPNCAISTAAQTNLNNRILMIGSTAPDPSKYFTIGGVSSCIGPMMNIDLSNLIPDPMGILTSLAKAALQMAIQKACTAARQSLSDYLGKYNMTAAMMNGGANNMIASSIGQQVGLNLTNYSTNYAAPAGSQLVVSPLGTVTSAANSTLGSTLTSAQSGITSTAQSATAPVSSGYSTVTSGVTSAVSGVVSSVQSGASSLGSSVFGSSSGN